MQAHIRRTVKPLALFHTNLLHDPQFHTLHWKRLVARLCFEAPLCSLMECFLAGGDGEPPVFIGPDQLRFTVAHVRGAHPSSLVECTCCYGDGCF